MTDGRVSGDAGSPVHWRSIGTGSGRSSGDRGFDTGFVCYFRGWHQPRRDDLGLLWEHYVLNELHARLQTRRINYWRDKQGHEVDSVLARRGEPPLAIECKWSANDFDPGALKVFAARYPKAEVFVVAQDVERSYTKRYDTLSVVFTGLESFVRRLQNTSLRQSAIRASSN